MKKSIRRITVLFLVLSLLVCMPVVSHAEISVPDDPADVEPVVLGSGGFDVSSGFDSRADVIIAELGTTVGDFKTEIGSVQYTLTKANGSAVADSDLIATGMKFTANGTKYEMLVRGDTDGDGVITVADALNALICFNGDLISEHAIVSKPIIGAYRDAALVTPGAAAVSILDILYILNSTITASFPTFEGNQTIGLVSPADEATVNLDNDAVRAYMALDELDYESVNAVANGKRESYITPVILKWTGNTSSYDIALATDAQFSDVKIYHSTANILYLYNLQPATTYYWHVTGHNQNNQTVTRSFTTNTPTVRTVYIDGVSNSRDLGGYLTADGKYRIKYNTIYRGNRLNGMTDVGVKDFCETLGIKSEINLTNEAVSSDKLKGLVNTTNNAMPWYGNIFSRTERADKPGTANNLAIVADANNLPAYFHCSVGRDRTGTFSFLLLGLCGCSEEVIEREYYLTLFSMVNMADSGSFKTLAPNYATLIDGMKALDTNATLQHNIVKFLQEKMGVPVAQLEAIRANLLEPVDPNDAPAFTPFEEYELPVQPVGQSITLTFDGNESNYSLSDLGISGITNAVSSGDCGYTTYDGKACYKISGSSQAGFLVTFKQPISITSSSQVYIKYRTSVPITSSSAARVLKYNATSNSAMINNSPTGHVLSGGSSAWVEESLECSGITTLNDSNGNLSAFKFYIRIKDSGAVFYIDSITVK